MNKNYKGFTLIEIIIASFILSIAVFGILKMISENRKLINNSEQSIEANILFPNIKECINHIGYNNFFSSTQTGFSLNYGASNNGCLTGKLNSSPISINSIDYYINLEILNKDIDKINWLIEINGEGLQTIKKEYIQYKK